jgi:hypothetical protein
MQDLKPSTKRNPSEGIALVSLKNLPYATIAFSVSIYVLTYHVWAGRAIGLPLTIGGYDPIVLLHPVLVSVFSGYDFISSILPLLIAGTLIESWMIISHKWRFGILGLCYFVSLASITVERYFLRPHEGIILGPSRLVSAGLGFIMIYYVLFRKRIRLHGLGMFAPIGIGLLIWPMIDLFLRWFPQAAYFATYQLPSLAFGLLLAYPLLRRLREENPEH